MNKSAVNCKQSNFWNDLRVKNDYSYQLLSDTLDVDTSVLGSWFAGRTVPRKTNKKFKAMCDLFGIDFETGYAEMVKAHENWKPDGKTAKVARRSSDVEAAEDSSSSFENVGIEEVDIEEFMSNMSEAPEAAAETLGDNKDKYDSFDLFKFVYGKVSYEDYEAMRLAQATNLDPLEVLYGKISCEDFTALVTQLR